VAESDTTFYEDYGGEVHQVVQFLCETKSVFVQSMSRPRVF